MPIVTSTLYLRWEPHTWEVDPVAPHEGSPEPYYRLHLRTGTCGTAAVTAFAHAESLTQLRDALLAEFPILSEEPEPEPEPEPDFPALIARILADVPIDVEGVRGPFQDPHSGGIYITRDGDDALIYCTPGWEGCQGIAVSVVRDGENVHDEYIEDPALGAGHALGDALLWRGYMVWWLKQHRAGGAQ